MRRTGLFIDDAGKKGRGVFTNKSIPANTVVEVSPVIVLTAKDRKKIENTKLFFYIFEWGDDISQAVVGLGYVSMYNHTMQNNCEYEMDYDKETITIRTIRNIKPGEELTINYSAGWDDWQPSWPKKEKTSKKQTK